MTAYRDDVTMNYLFDSSDFPKDLLDENLIRNANERGEISVDVASYMKNGGGRFANASNFELIQIFFENSTAVPSGTYTKEELAAAYSLSSFGLDIRQFYYLDGRRLCRANLRFQ